MTDQATRVVPAGWYEDPADAEQVRWWNGIAWTDHTQPKPTSDAAAETAELEKRFSDSGGSVHPRVRKLSASTSSSWLIAFSPILFALVAAAAIVVPFYSTQASLLWAGLALPYVLTVLWAFLDVRKLKRWGHNPPAALFGLLGPLVYLVVRKLKVAGWGQLATLLVLLVGLGGAGYAVSSTELGRPVTLALTVQSEIRAELVGSGEALDVACPPIADSTAVGTLYTCDVTLATGAHKQLLVSIDSDQGDYSYTFSLK